MFRSIDGLSIFIFIEGIHKRDGGVDISQIRIGGVTTAPSQRRRSETLGRKDTIRKVQDSKIIN